MLKALSNGRLELTLVGWRTRHILDIGCSMHPNFEARSPLRSKVLPEVTLLTLD